VIRIGRAVSACNRAMLSSNSWAKVAQCVVIPSRLKSPQL
jgi:hypothetical protein